MRDAFNSGSEGAQRPRHPPACPHCKGITARPAQSAGQSNRPHLPVLQAIENQFDAAGDAQFIEQANQVLVPTVAALQERDPDSILRVYRDSYRLILYLSVPSFAFLLAVSPVVSVVWLGSYQPMFVCFVALLTVGWLANILGNPAYVVDLGTGALRRITAGCLTTCILNFALGLAGGKFFGGTGVVAASAFSLMLGYALILIQFHRENRLPFSVLLPRESLKIILSSILAGLLLFPYLRRVTVIIPFSRGTAGLLLGVLLIAILIPMWAHPLRRRVWRWALSRSSA